MTSLEQKFDMLIAWVSEAVTSVDADKLGDFTKLNEDITAICLEAQKAEPDIAKTIKSRMGALVSRLDELAASITAYQARLMERKR